MFSRGLLGFPQNRREVHTFVLHEKSPQLLAHPGLDLLAIPADLDWLPLVPGIIKVLDLVEAEVSPAHPVYLEHTAQGPGGEARRQNPAHAGAVSPGLGRQARQAAKLARFLRIISLMFHQDIKVLCTYLD